jgi:hypothetical protein
MIFEAVGEAVADVEVCCARKVDQAEHWARLSGAWYIE